MIDSLDAWPDLRLSTSDQQPEKRACHQAHSSAQQPPPSPVRSRTSREHDFCTLHHHHHQHYKPRQLTPSCPPPLPTPFLLTNPMTPPRRAHPINRQNPLAIRIIIPTNRHTATLLTPMIDQILHALSDHLPPDPVLGNIVLQEHAEPAPRLRDRDARDVRTRPVVRIVHVVGRQRAARQRLPFCGGAGAVDE